MMKPITMFKGKYGFLSNFWPCTVYLPTDLGHYLCSSVEQAYQASKCKHGVERAGILRAKTPAETKRLGRQVEVRKDWEQVKLRIMADLVWQKFCNNHELREKLLATRDTELVEGNVWGDTFWGVYRGKGLNHLGIILMRVREFLQHVEA